MRKLAWPAPSMMLQEAGGVQAAVWEEREREREVRLSELAVVERPSQSLVGVVYASCQQAAAGCDGRAAALRLCEVERTVHCYKGGMRLCGCRPRRARAAKREKDRRALD
jgi:hypothetical protein